MFVFSFLNLFKKRANRHAASYTTDALNIRNKTLGIDDFLFERKLIRKHKWLAGYNDKLDETILKLLQTKDRKTLMSTLLNKFEYVSYDDNRKLLNIIVNQINNVWKCNPEKTILMTTKFKDDRRADGSSVLLYKLQELMMGGWNEKNFSVYFNCDCNEIKEHNYDVILCDDFIGSGWTVTDRTKLILAENKSIKIYIVALAGMGSAYKRVERLKKKLNLDNIEYFTSKSLNAGFERKSKDQSIMQDIENLLSKNYRSYSLDKCTMGWGNTRALYFNEQYRIPNSCFPMFWWGKMKNGDDLNSIFLRS